MKRNCRAIKQKNQKLEKELRKQNKKVGIIYIKDMTQSLGMLFCAFAYHIVCNAQVDAQRFVMTNLRNGIDYLKEQCSQNSGSQGMQIY